MKKFDWWLVQYVATTMVTLLCTITWIYLYSQDDIKWVAWAFITVLFYLGKLELKLNKLQK